MHMTAIAKKRSRPKMDMKTRRRKVGHIIGRILFYLVCACLALTVTVALPVLVV